jgi:hypothetical protein
MIAGADAAMGKMNLLRTARRRQARAALQADISRCARNGISRRFDGRQFEHFAS